MVDHVPLTAQRLSRWSATTIIRSSSSSEVIEMLSCSMNRFWAAPRLTFTSQTSLNPSTDTLMLNRPTGPGIHRGNSSGSNSIAEPSGMTQLDEGTNTEPLLPRESNWSTSSTSVSSAVMLLSTAVNCRSMGEPITTSISTVLLTSPTQAHTW